MQSLAARIILAVVIAVVAWVVTYLVGLLITLVPFIAVIGEFIKGISVIVGILAGVWYAVTQKNPLR